MGMINFYEGTEATQHYIGKLSSTLSQTYDLSRASAPIGDGEALSCTLLDVEPGTKIKLFNSASPSQGEGYTEITVRAFVGEKFVNRAEIVRVLFFLGGWEKLGRWAILFCQVRPTFTLHVE